MESNQLHKGSYVQVCYTDDEYEGLIGIIEDFYYENDNSCSQSHPGAICVVRFPLSRRERMQRKMVGVNFFTDYVRYQLVLNDGLDLFKKDKLEEIDPNDI